MGHLVITIGCEYGAKGNQIGKKLPMIITYLWPDFLKCLMK